MRAHAIERRFQFRSQTPLCSVLLSPDVVSQARPTSALLRKWVWLARLAQTPFKLNAPLLDRKGGGVNNLSVAKN